MKVIAIIFAMLVGGFIVGCDKTVDETTTSHTDREGTKTTEHRKVTENNEGDKKVTHEKEVDRP